MFLARMANVDDLYIEIMKVTASSWVFIVDKTCKIRLQCYNIFRRGRESDRFPE